MAAAGLFRVPMHLADASWLRQISAAYVQGCCPDFKFAKRNKATRVCDRLKLAWLAQGSIFFLF